MLILMALVGAMSLARQGKLLGTNARVIPGAQVLTKERIDGRAVSDATPVEADSTAEAARVLGIDRRTVTHDGE